MSYNILNIIGDMSVYEFFLITTLSLIRNYNLLIFFIIGFLLNCILNNISVYIFKNYVNQFGLIDPSGHFQTFAFCYIFYILSHKKINPYILFLLLFIALCCLMNCIIFNYHTQFEIILGTIFGMLFSYFYFINKKPFGFPFVRNQI